MKKTIAILLSLALVVCMIPATAFGEAISAPDNIVNWVSITKDATAYLCDVQLSGTNVKYNSTEQFPTITVTPTVQGVTVTKGTDYEVKYVRVGGSGEVVVPKEAGTYKVLIKVGANYYYVGDFTIAALSINDLTFKVNNAPLTFTAVTKANGSLEGLFGIYYGNTKLTGSDVNVTATKNESENKITVVFSTLASGGNLPQYSIEKEFNIQTLLGTDYDVSVTVSDNQYTGDPIVPTVAVNKKLGSQASQDTLSKDVDYTVTVRNNINKGTATVIVEGIESANCVGRVDKTFDITARSISDATVKTGTEYTTPGGYPELVLEYNGKTLIQGTDYDYTDVTSSDATLETKVTAMVKGKGNFGGEKEVKEIMVRAASTNIANATLTLSGTSYTYNGAAQYPTVSSIKMPGSTSSLSSSYYTVSYQKADGTAISAANIKDVGTYKIVVTGKDGYTGIQTKTFTIGQLDINSSSVSATFTGSPSYNPVKLQLGSKVLTWSTDYDVESYSSYKPYYTVTGKGNFKGTRLVYTTTINLSSCTVNFTDNRSSGVYGPTYSPDVTVYYGSTRLKKDTDYTVTYKNSKNQTVSYCKDTGTYSVIVTGIGTYTGTKTLYFTITGTDISGYTVTLKNPSVTATGYSQTPVITSVKYGYYSSLSSNDYTVSYQDATGKTVYSMSAPGTYRVVVTGKNGYSGTTYATFRIVGLTQTVTVTQDSYKVYDDSDVFKITAKATGDGTGFTYTSSNPTVASVSYNGVVTPHKVGRAVITVTTTGNKKYEPASEQVVVKVYPDKAKLSKKPWTDGKASQLKVRWGYQDGVTKYQVRYSRDKNFKSGTYLTKTVKAHGKAYTTQSTTLSNLKRGYTYYVKVRAVYTDPVTGDNYYGSWSGWRSAKTI